MPGPTVLARDGAVSDEHRRDCPSGDTSAVVVRGDSNRDPPRGTEVNGGGRPRSNECWTRPREDPTIFVTRGHRPQDRLTGFAVISIRWPPGSRRKRHTRGGEQDRPRSPLRAVFRESQRGQEDEYFRDGITEDIITELSKNQGLNTFSRPTVLAYRHKPVDAKHESVRNSGRVLLTGSCACGQSPRITRSWGHTHRTFHSGRNATTAR